MQPEARREADEWLQRADRDLIIAARAIDGVPALADQAAYHAQQATEKALKSFLAAHNRPLQKTHNLERLVAQCRGVDPTFGDFLASARTLNPYATVFRYPGGPLEPSRDEAQRAIQLAREIVDRVREQLRNPEDG
ncbi:MAG TPA: HEPN domain-containing protein [Chloroflexota bacterium]|nr:HEPN domain-containing protein [Chloroflexota bacterium]